MKNIALCGIEEVLISTLERCGEYHFLRFFDEPERCGDVKLAYFLVDGPSVVLSVVGYPGAEGIATCDYLRTQNCGLPILWLCNRREFEAEEKRLGVNFYGTGPPDIVCLATRLVSTISLTDAE